MQRDGIAERVVAGVTVVRGTYMRGLFWVLHIFDTAREG